MARAVYSPEQISAELDAQLPAINKGSSTPVPKELAMALLMVENMDKDGNVSFQNAVNPSSGAQGVGQVMPDTIKLLKKASFLPADFPEDLRDAPVRQQVQASLAVVKELVTRLKTTDPDKIGANYNASPKATKKFMETGNTMYLPAETQMYLPKMQKAYEMQGVEYPVAPSPANVRPNQQLMNLYGDANAMFQKNMEMLPAVLAAITGASANSAVQSGIQQQAVIAAGNSAAEAARIGAEDQISQDMVHRDILNALGMDVRDPQAAIRQEMDRAAVARANREKLDSRITELQSKSLFSDPIGWLAAIPEIASLVPQYNQQATLENSANASIGKMMQIAASAKSLTPTRSADLIRAKAAADANVQLENAKMKAAAINEKNAAGQAKAILDQWTIGDNVFQRVLQLDAREAQLVLKNMQIEAKNQADAERKLKDVQDSTFLEGVNKFRKLIAGNVPDYTMADLKTMPPKLRDEWNRVVMRGGFGNYKDAIMFIDEFGNEVGAAESGNATMMQLVRKLRADADALSTKVMNDHNSKNPFSKINQRQALDRAYDVLFAEAGSIANKTFDKGIMPANSPYALDFDTLAAAAKASPDNTISKILLQAKTNNQFKSLNNVLQPRDILTAVEAEVKAGTVVPAKAALELAGFFKAAEDNVYTTSGLRYLGLPQLKEFTIKPGAIGNKELDLYNPSAVEAYLTAQVAQAKRIKNVQEGNAIFGESKDYQQPYRGTFGAAMQYKDQP